MARPAGRNWGGVTDMQAELGPGSWRPAGKGTEGLGQAGETRALISTSLRSDQSLRTKDTLTVTVRLRE